MCETPQNLSIITFKEVKLVNICKHTHTTTKVLQKISPKHSKINNENLTQTVTKILTEVLFPTFNFFYEATTNLKSKSYEEIWRWKL